MEDADIDDVINSQTELIHDGQFPEPSPHDIQIMQSIAGIYAYLYMARKHGWGSPYILGEFAEIFECDHSKKKNRAKILQSVVTNNEIQGEACCIADRVTMIFHHRDFYPPSYFILQPYQIDEQYALYGIYSDVSAAPRKQIFAARVLFLPVSSTENKKIIIEEDQAAFREFAAVLGNELNERVRLVAEDVEKGAPALAGALDRLIK